MIRILLYIALLILPALAAAQGSVAGSWRVVDNRTTPTATYLHANDRGTTVTGTLNALSGVDATTATIGQATATSVTAELIKGTRGGGSPTEYVVGIFEGQVRIDGNPNEAESSLLEVETTGDESPAARFVGEGHGISAKSKNPGWSAVVGISSGSSDVWQGNASGEHYTGVRSRITASGSMRSSDTLVSQATRWVTIPATPYATAYSSVVGDGWYVDKSDPTCLATADISGAYAFIPITAVPGTVISKIRVKWQTDEVATGVRIALAKRDESTTGTSYTIIGSEQDYTVGTTVIVSTYDHADETVAENYSYAIRLRPYAAGADDPVRVYAVAYETTSRTY